MAQAAGEFQVVDIGEIIESQTNPRKHFAKVALQDLTESVKEKGVLVPLLVRRNLIGEADVISGFEIVAGARRYRAAKAAGLTQVPVLIRDLDDVQALEVQVIENLQRADVHPLEEAEGYKQLLEKGKYDVESLAAKVGKSVSYVYQRLKLADLVPAAKKAFFEEHITAGHAILLARLQSDQQKEGLAECLNDWNSPSVRELGTWIEENVHLDLAKAPWQKDDAKLLPAAGACTTCPKRTGATPALFADIKKGDTCTDPKCFHAKLEALVNIKLEQDATAQLVSNQSAYSDNDEKALKKRYPSLLMEREYRKAGATKCASTKNALIVDGDRAGTFIRICVNHKCKTHRDPYGGSVYAPARRSKAEVAAGTKRKAKADTDRRVHDLAYSEIVRHARTLKDQTLEDLRLITGQLADALYGERDQLATIFGLKNGSQLTEKWIGTLNRGDLAALGLACALSEGYLTDKGFAEVAKRHKVDIAALRKALQTSAKKKAA